MTRAWRVTFGVSVLLWAAVILGAALIASRGGSPLDVAAAAVYAIGAVVCHQQPARSFVLAGAQLPVCARCTGIYMGAALAVVGLMLQGPRRMPSPFSNDGATRRWRVLLAAAVAPSLLSLIYEWTTGVTPLNLTRALAGAPVGIIVAALVWVTLGDSRESRGDQVH